MAASVAMKPHGRRPATPARRFPHYDHKLTMINGFHKSPARETRKGETSERAAALTAEEAIV